MHTIPELTTTDNRMCSTGVYHRPYLSYVCVCVCVCVCVLVCVCVCVCSMWHDLLPLDFYNSFWNTIKEKITCGVWINFFLKIQRQIDAYVRVRAWFARTGVQTARGGLVCLPPKATPSQTHHAPRNNAITNPPRTQHLADSEAAHCHAH